MERDNVSSLCAAILQFLESGPGYEWDRKNMNEGVYDKSACTVSIYSRKHEYFS
jgi:hypothetical protein